MRKRIRPGRISVSLMAAVLAAALLLGNLAAPGAFVQAAQKEGEGPYTYTVTIYPGAKGNFSGKAADVISSTAAAEVSGSKIVISNLSYGDRISINSLNVDLGEYSGVYYAKGVRRAGRDSSTASAVDKTSFTVEEDADYVIAYALLTDPAYYIVRYVDANGTKLRDDRTGFANEGDEFYVSAEAITGYRPDAYNKVLTLQECKEGDETNLITFVYSPIGTTTETEVVTSTETVTIPGTVTTVNAGGGGAGEGTVVTGEAAGGGGGGGGEPLVTIDEGETPLAGNAEEPEDLISLDDEETPTDIFQLEENSASRNMILIYAAIALLGFLGLFGGYIFLAKRRKNEDEENDEN